MPAANRRSRLERRLAFLNAVLVANAVLLAAVAWTSLAGGSAANLAYAGPQNSGSGQSQQDAFPNASSQRLQMIAELKGLRSDVGRIESMLGGGRLRFAIANPGDIKFEIDYAKLKQALKD